jgi:predicted 2-oxoglutarate/Fe(II)-dependent dioxygenase YbiX
MEINIPYRDYDAPTFYRSQYQKLSEVAQACYHIEPNVLNSAEIRLVHNIADFYKDKLKPMTLAPNGSEVKMNFNSLSIGRLPEFEYIDNRILRKILEINSKYFQVNLTSRDYTNCNIYKENEYIDWHADDVLLPYGNLQENQVYRKLSSTLSLTDHSEYEGGDFQILSFKDNPNRCLQNIRLEAGSLIVFPAFMMHRVLPITKGTRKTLIHRLNGNKWQ